MTRRAAAWTALALALAALLAAPATAASSSTVAPWPWMRRPLGTPASRARAVLAEMSAAEKLAMVHGNGTKPYVGNVGGNARLGIPTLSLEDGPQGVGDGATNVTAWPSALTVTATWSTELMTEFAAAMAAEQRGKGTNVVLAPMVNLARVPSDGRQYESVGEDPALGEAMAAASVRGIQSQGVLGCVKHWAFNNQEHDRRSVSSEVDLRTAYELYYRPFRAAIEAGVGSVMCSYNRVNGTYACENPETLGRDLKGVLGYDYFVMSDWGATHSTVAAANAGLDMEMPGDTYFGQALAAAVADGRVPAARLDDMVLRILTPMFALGLFDRPREGSLDAAVDTPAHAALARRLAAEATVLLQNRGGALPLGAGVRRIAVIGDDAGAWPVAEGGGSGFVVPPYVVSPLDGIRQRAGAGANVTYTPSGSPAAAARAAAAADAALVFVSSWSHEGEDRANLSLPAGQDAMVAAVAAAQPRTVVVMHTTGAVLTPWRANVSALVAAFMPGQEDGHAIADVLFGDADPGGRLPLTFPESERGAPFYGRPEQYPGVDGVARYTEGLEIGYRWYQAAAGRVAAFGFGDGLSYADVRVAAVQLDAGAAAPGFTVLVENRDAARNGTAVPQLYVGFPQQYGEPVWQLVRFEKVTLPPSGGATVQWRLSPAKDLAYFDAASQAFVPATGTFRYSVCEGALQAGQNPATSGTFVV